MHTRQNVGGVATALGPSLQAAEQGGSVTGVLPIQQNLQRLIKRGIAVNEATKTPSKVCLQPVELYAQFCCLTHKGRKVLGMKAPPVQASNKKIV